MVAVPMNPKLHVAEYKYMIEHSSAQAVFATPDLWETASTAASRFVRCYCGACASTFVV